MIEVKGLDPIVRQLGADVAPALSAASMGIAAEVQDRIAPYPAPPTNSRYLRGYGMRGGKKTSETLGRRWSIQAGYAAVVLRNVASYARYVHDSKLQARIHQNRWTTDVEATQQVERDGTVERIVGAALRKLFGL
jgi:hypothetical protein